MNSNNIINQYQQEFYNEAGDFVKFEQKATLGLNKDNKDKIDFIIIENNYYDLRNATYMKIFSKNNKLVGIIEFGFKGVNGIYDIYENKAYLSEEYVKFEAKPIEDENLKINYNNLDNDIIEKFDFIATREKMMLKILLRIMIPFFSIKKNY